MFRFIEKRIKMIKEKDKRIIKLLRNNSRMKLKEISLELDMPITTVFERMKTIKKLILKNTSILDYKKINYPIKVIYGINAYDLNKDKIIQYLNKDKNVDNLFHCNGSYNILIEAFFVDLNEANEFYESLKLFYPMKITEHQVINDIKKEEFYT